MSSDTVPVGKIVGVHGIRGEVKISPYGDPDDFVFGEISLTGESGARKILAMRPHKGVLLVALEGVKTRNDAEELKGREVSVPEEALPEAGEDEFYYYTLMGCSVVTESGEDLGTVTNIIETGANDVIEVNGPGGEILIPVVEQTVIEVDTDEGRVTVRLMEGMEPEKPAEKAKKDRRGSGGRRRGGRGESGR